MPTLGVSKQILLGLLCASTMAVANPYSKPVPGPFHGFVVGIVDGDTVKVINRSRYHMIRLAYIDAPELDQRHGPESMRCLQRLIYRKTVFVRPLYYDRYERLVAQIDVEKVNANVLMVQLGCAWHLYRYSQSDLWQEYHNEARAAKKGLWKHRRPMKPSVYRRRHSRYY